MDTFLQKATLPFSIELPSQWGRRRGSDQLFNEKVAPVGEKCFLQEKTHFWKNFIIQRSKQEFTHLLSPLEKMAIQSRGKPFNIIQYYLYDTLKDHLKARNTLEKRT